MPDDHQLTSDDDEGIARPSSSPTNVVSHPFTLVQNTPCMNCGYNLRGLDSDGNCPECGGAVGLSLGDFPLVRRPERETLIELPVACTRCGHSLQSLTTHSACPTCGAPAWFSIYGTWLRASDPTWLRRVRSGFTLWLWAIGVTIGLAVLGGIIGAAVVFPAAIAAAQSGTANPQGMATLVEERMWLFVLPAIIPAVLKVLAAYRVSAPDPRKLVVDEDAGLRAILRTSSVLWLVLGVGGALANLATPPKWVNVAVALSGLVGIAVTGCMLLYIRQYAARIPKPSWVRYTTLVAWGFCSALALQTITGVAFALTVDPASFTQTAGGAAPAIPNANLMPVDIVTCVMMPFAAVFGIWMLVLIFQIRSATTRALTQALQETGNALPGAPV